MCVLGPLRPIVAYYFQWLPHLQRLIDCLIFCRSMGVSVLERWQHLPSRLSSIQIAGFLMQLRRPIWEVRGSFHMIHIQTMSILVNLPNSQSNEPKPCEGFGWSEANPGAQKLDRIRVNLSIWVNMISQYFNTFDTVNTRPRAERLERCPSMILPLLSGGLWTWRISTDLVWRPEPTIFPWANLQLGTRCSNV